MNLSQYRNNNTDIIYRLMWSLVWTFLIRWLPRKYPAGWYKFWLRLFGAKIARTATVYNSARIYSPRNLTIGEHSTLSDQVIAYSVTDIELGDNVLVSQGCHLCAATHDYRLSSFDLITKAIVIKSNTWVAMSSSALE